jgi:hypothetical protein
MTIDDCLRGWKMAGDTRQRVVAMRKQHEGMRRDKLGNPGKAR